MSKFRFTLATEVVETVKANNVCLDSLNRQIEAVLTEVSETAETSGKDARFKLTADAFQARQSNKVTGQIALTGLTESGQIVAKFLVWASLVQESFTKFGEAWSVEMPTGLASALKVHFPYSAE